MSPYIHVSRHAVERVNERFLRHGEKPFTRQDIRELVSRRIRRPGHWMVRSKEGHGDGFTLPCKGFRLVVKPRPMGGWDVITAWASPGRERGA